MPTWELIGYIVAAVFLILGVGILLLKRKYDVTGIEIGFPPKMTFGPKTATKSPSHKRTAVARRKGILDQIDMTDQGGGDKTVTAEDDSRATNIRM